MSITSIIEDASAELEIALSDMTPVSADKLGLDMRAGYALHIDRDWIIVPLNNDGSLQYYGGFEYVNKQYRTVLGRWVLYSGEDERVREAIDRWEGVEEQLCEECGERNCTEHTVEA